MPMLRNSLNWYETLVTQRQYERYGKQRFEEDEQILTLENTIPLT